MCWSQGQIQIFLRYAVYCSCSVKICNFSQFRFKKLISELFLLILLFRHFFVILNPEKSDFRFSDIYMKQIHRGRTMNEFTCYVGNQIKSYRKAARLTLQQLGDAIHKSRATVCKYESGEISPDLETLYEISQILQVSPAQLTAIHPDIQHPFVFGVPAATETTDVPGRMQKNPFFQARRLYFYFYDGRCRRIKAAFSSPACCCPPPCGFRASP